MAPPHTPDLYMLSRYFDYGATVLWAISGAMLAARRGYAILGILTLALISSTGGGLLRDGLFLQNGPPQVLRTPVYLVLVAIGSALVLLFGGHLRRARWFESALASVDALGAGLYAIVGMNLALEAGLPVVAVAMVGTVNAVGGGLLRDVVIGVEPGLFKPGVPYALAAMGGCVLFLFLIRVAEFSQLDADLITIAAVLAARVAAVRFGLKTKALPAFEDDWRARSRDTSSDRPPFDRNAK
jgi:uncharacterized membrane protein YeiH